ncbi:aldehyde dehydrogenase family protein [Defluviimonas aestuarii]|uniref:aldehyde dehydrogenase family protein n=1 Tax=Albidovulum aestuarii TaxID=1130726 RepID=UPI00249A6707|nr:aldehyde dehydrogenase family protein [Defluviimonas aestuarii]MDI3337379.1 aldehyde dehydrogenase family protein [Defluviimonas aestuarii]
MDSDAATSELGRLTSILAMQRAAASIGGVPDLAARRTDLSCMKASIRARRLDFVRAAQEDFGRRPAEDTLILDLGPVVQGINHMRRHLGRWMRPERVPVSHTLWPGRARIHRQPLGVIGIMSPWNYPFGLSLMPLATALAAGNRAMLKPSELAPASSRLLADLLGDIFDVDQVAVVEGGVETGAAFASLPFDHLFFTGSTEIGRKVMRAAAENLVPVTLELGGKSPVILARDADFAKAARDIAFGKVANSGQTCIAPDYALVHEDDAAEFIARLQVELARTTETAARRGGPTGIISSRHAERLAALLDEARAGGAEVTGAGETGGGAPAIVTGLKPEMRLMREEIFGPLLPVVTYATIKEAIARIGGGSYPLALYLYTADRDLKDRVLRETISGNVTLNGVMTHYAVESLPFGGVGASGIGAYHGRAGFEAMSHARGVFTEPRRSFIPLGRPAGRFAKLFARYTMR